MDRKKASTDATGAQYAKAAACGASTAIHDLLGMTPEDVEADIASRGKSVMSVLKRFGAMERKAAAKFFDQRGESSKVSKGDYRLDLSRSAHFSAPGTEPDWTAVVVVRATIDADDAELLNDGRLEMSVFLDTKTTPRDGDVVLAFIEGQGQALRRFRQVGMDLVSLEPLADRFSPAESGHPSQVVIHGVVVGRAAPM